MPRPSSDPTLFRIPVNRVRVAPRQPLSRDAMAALEKATWLYAATRNRLDPEPLIAGLAENAVYESQDVLDPLIGRAAVADYLRGRYAYLRSLDDGAGCVEFGVVEIAPGTAVPCGIFVLAGERLSLAVLTLNAGGLIARIDLLTVLPHPSTARGSGEIPQ